MNKTVSMLGLCARARQLQSGTNLTCESVRGGRCVLVCYASDASAGTKKKITNCCAYYGVQCAELAASTVELGHSIGKRGAVSAVAVQDANFAKAIQESMNK
ncbi:MAG: ribosomal L7Ae/L30e/S12e/Gadd45 family protein [Clostridia bacterium]|nr:ribosomal L7Ae/L30e/S12e/Gadd45 family protein [Clostridia bacterium]